MKEKFVINKEIDSVGLTKSTSSPNLELRGNIYMPDNGNEENKGFQPHEQASAEVNRDELLINFKKKISDQWQEQFPLPESAPYFVRSFINAAIDSGVGPDRVSEEQRETLRRMIEGVGENKPEADPGDGGENPPSSSGNGAGENPPSSPPSASPESDGGDGEFVFEEILVQEGNEGLKEMYEGLDEDQKKFARQRAQEMYAVLGQGGLQEAVILLSLQAAQVQKDIEDKLKETVEKKGDQNISLEKAVRDFQRSFRDSRDRISNANSVDQVMEDLNNFIYYAEKTQTVAPGKFAAEYKSKIDQLKSFMTQGNIDEIKKLIKPFSEEVRVHYLTPESVMPDIPESLEDLAAFIMRSESEQWKTTKSNELLNSEGKVVKENILAWARKRIMEVHNFNPTTTVDFFSQITVKSRYSQISLYEMVLTGSYFLEKVEEPVIVPDVKNGVETKGEEQIASRTVYRKNEDYEKLRQELLMEAFLFNTSRNNHVEYVNIQHSDSELPKVIQKLYATNVFTRSNNMELILSMASMNRKRQTDAEKANFVKGKEIENKLNHNFEVGQAFRNLLLAYYYIYDYDSLEKILGPDAALFAREYESINDQGEPMKDSEGRIIKKHSEGMKRPGEPYKTSDWFRDNNNNQLDQVWVDPSTGRPPREFMEYINVFSGPGPNKDETIINEVRERMIQSIMKKMNMDYSEAQYAEAWAFSMTRWTGLGAKNDVAAVGDDAYTKILDFQEYRLRQMSENRDAIYGNIFNVLGIKRLGLNMFEGIRDTQGRSIIEMIQGGQGREMRLDKSVKELWGEDKKVRFPQLAMSTFYGNHVGNSFALYDFLIEHNEFKLEEMLKLDSMGRPVIDYEKANKMIDVIEKGIRYAYSTWGGTDFDKKVLTWEKVPEKYIDEYGVEQQRENVEARVLPILTELFGKEILVKMKKRIDLQDKRRMAKMKKDGREKYARDIRNKPSDVWLIEGATNKDGEKIEEDMTIDVKRVQRDIRETLWKEVFKYLVEAEIESHRNFHSDQERLDMISMEKIYAYLLRRNTFTKEEIEEMRRNTHTTTSGMLLQEGGFSAVSGGLVGAFKKIRASLGDITKTH